MKENGGSPGPKAWGPRDCACGPGPVPHSLSIYKRELATRFPLLSPVFRIKLDNGFMIITISRSCLPPNGCSGQPDPGSWQMGMLCWLPRNQSDLPLHTLLLTWEASVSASSYQVNQGYFINNYIGYALSGTNPLILDLPGNCKILVLRMFRSAEQI